MRSPTAIDGVPQDLLRASEVILAIWAVLPHFCVLNSVCILPIYLRLPRNWSAETKVAQFHGAVLVDQDIGGLDVPVHDSCCVQEVHGHQQIVEYLNHLINLERGQLFGDNIHDFSEVTFHAVHHNKYVVELDPVFLEVGLLLLVEVTEAVFLDWILVGLRINDDVEDFGRIRVFAGHILLHFRQAPENLYFP